jgi:hypothetical protein
MADYIKSDFELDQYCRAMAKQILDEFAEYGGDLSDLIHETADSSEHVIYFGKAHSICQNCNVDNGEAFIEETGTPEDGWSYNGIAVAIAYGEIVARLNSFIQEMQDAEEMV